MRKYNFILSIILTIFMLCGCTAANLSKEAVQDGTANTSASASPAASNMLTVHYIDVGQGDSILITTPDNKNMLIDAGEGENNRGSVIKYLNSANITSLDTVIATHPHSDHINAMADVLKAIPVSHFYMPNAVHTTRDFENMLNALEAVPDVVQAKAGINFNLGDNVTCNILAPVSDSYDNLNNYSVVVKLSYGDTSFLFTGDAEVLVENEILKTGCNVNATVLKCGHHGSSTSTGDKFLEAVNPKYAVISCGKNNDYGHPHRETMQKLKNKAITVLRTDEMGTITLQSDGKTVSQPQNGLVSEYTTAQSPAQSSTQSYIGNTNSKKYHTANCSSLPKEKNRIYFSSKNQAESNGYSPCQSCNP